MCPNIKDMHRLRINIHGAVQGVGFRPFIYRLASEMSLNGWVLNHSRGVTLEVEGDILTLQRFLIRIEPEKPPAAFIQSLESSWLEPVGYDDFKIRASIEDGNKSAFILPDLAVCTDCLKEMSDPANRRYRYPFINCTNCGPRFSILESLPYDRPNTTMKRFDMCAECQKEYSDPTDRRFHAQPIACPVCGPRLFLCDDEGNRLALDDEALILTADEIRNGKIVAVKGLGGFHLMCDSRNPSTVSKLRQRKRREEKPFALMYPDLELAAAHCDISPLEARALLSSQSPILLLKHRFVMFAGLHEWRLKENNESDESLIPHPYCLMSEENSYPLNPYLGVVLPYTPLHHLLLSELAFPVVATSGNLKDEPICIDDREALSRLKGIADLFLMHDRPIARQVDDSIVRIMMGREMLLRRARGYAPLPVMLHYSAARTYLAVGAHQKNCIAMNAEKQVFISQHIGDLETVEAFESFQKVTRDFERLYDRSYDAVVHDLHPDYLSTKYAKESTLPNIGVQHHHAHILSCMAENEISIPFLGVSWDGTGYGLDGTIWGGEFLKVSRDGISRFASFRPFRLLGGEIAVKEPRRLAMALLHACHGSDVFIGMYPWLSSAFTQIELNLFRRMLEKGIRSPWTTSVGRLFDGIACLAGLRRIVRHEGQAAMELEYALEDVVEDQVYPFQIIEKGGQTNQVGNSAATPAFEINWIPLIDALWMDREREITPGIISARFHNSLAEMIVQAAKYANLERVALSGGCFQNRYLTEHTIKRLQEERFHVYWHQRVPPNDGGIALGQIMFAAMKENGCL
jgi:hydrogenase maturation protein HypF